MLDLLELGPNFLFSDFLPLWAFLFLPELHLPTFSFNFPFLLSVFNFKIFLKLFLFNDYSFFITSDS